MNRFVFFFKKVYRHLIRHKNHHFILHVMLHSKSIIYRIRKDFRIKNVARPVCTQKKS